MASYTNGARGAYKGNVKTKANSQNKGGKIETTKILDIKAKMPEGAEHKFSTILSMSQYDDSKNFTASLNYGKLVELIESGVLTVNESGYINGLRKFDPFKG